MNRRSHELWGALALLALAIDGCAGAAPRAPDPSAAGGTPVAARPAAAPAAAGPTAPAAVPLAWPTGVPALKDVFRGSFLIGASLDLEQIFGWDFRADTIVEYHYNTITPENALKWERVHPARDTYDFVPADRYVAYGEKHGMFIVGHTLVWHAQVGQWVFEDGRGNPVGRDTLLARMRDHIFTVVGRYKGRIKGWDVVNEALNEDGTLRASPWLRLIGPDYIEKAFEYAHEADPSAELYYNDYSLENGPKRAGAVALIRKLRAEGVPVTGVGLQHHDRLDWPSVAQIDSTIDAFASLGVKVMVTELDVNVLPAPRRYRGADVSFSAESEARLNPYTLGLPDSVQQALAQRYAELFAAFRRHSGVLTRVTFWNVTDRDSWLNDFPVRNRTAYPLLFDRTYRPKPAFYAVVRAAQAQVMGR